jgi:hypothetical protein
MPWDRRKRAKKEPDNNWNLLRGRDSNQYQVKLLI